MTIKIDPMTASIHQQQDHPLDQEAKGRSDKQSPNRAGILMPPGSPPHEIGISPGRPMATVQTHSGPNDRHDSGSSGPSMRCNSEPSSGQLGVQVPPRIRP